MTALGAYLIVERLRDNGVPASVKPRRVGAAAMTQSGYSPTRAQYHFIEVE